MLESTLEILGTFTVRQNVGCMERASLELVTASGRASLTHCYDWACSTNMIPSNKTRIKF